MEAKFIFCAEDAGINDCLLCPNKISKELLHQKVVGSATTALQVLFKYLDIDVRRAALTSGDSGHHEAEGDDGLAMRLCEDCSSLANLFQEIHQDFETARLLLTGCVSKFMDRVRAASKLSSGTADGNQLWRAEILKQCDLHVQKVPKEELEKLLSDYSEPDRHSSLDELRELSFQHQTVTESIPIIPNVPEKSTSSSMVQNEVAPKLEEPGSDSGGVKPVSQLDDEMDQILKTNEDLIRRLSDVVSRTKFARQSTSTPSTNSASTTSNIQQVISPNVCLICGVTSTTAQSNQNHMMVAHTTSFFSEQFPPGTTEDEVTHVVSKLSEANITSAGKHRVSCNLCGSVQRAHSRKIHLLQTHLNDIITALKSEKGSSLGGTPRKQFPAFSSESSVERLRIQRLAAKLSGRAKLKCHICGQWCLSKQGLDRHTGYTHSKPIKLINPSTNLSALHKRVTNPSNSKPANPSTSVSSTSFTTTIQEVGSPNECLICGVTSCTAQNLQLHMMLVHTTSFFSEQFPPGTSEEQVAQVVSSLLQTNLSSAGKGRVNCKLCGGVQNAYSMRGHIISKHLNVILADLNKSDKGSPDTPITKVVTASSSETSVERLRMQRLAAKFSGGAKLKCRICGQWCVSKYGLTMHTRHFHSSSKPIKIIIKPSIKASQQVSKPSKPANPVPRARDTTATTTVARRRRKLPTCLYCSATYGTQTNCYRHMLVRHPLQVWADRLPPSTKQEDLNTAIKILEENHLAGSSRNKVNCRLCSRVCGEPSKAFHLLDRHASEVLATLNSLMEEGE